MPSTDFEQLRNQRANVGLTNFAKGFYTGRFVGDIIAPILPVIGTNVDYMTYTKNNLRTYDDEITRNEEIKKIHVEGTTESFSLKMYGLGTTIADDDVEDAAFDHFRIALEQREVENLVTTIARNREVRILKKALTDPSVPTQPIAVGWNDKVNSSPISDILKASATIQNGVRVKPNTLVLSPSAAMAMVQTEEWLKYFTNVTNATASQNSPMFSVAAGLAAWGITVVEADAQFLSSKKNTATDPVTTDAMGGNALLFYREPSPSNSSVTFMYSPTRYMNRVYRYRKENQRLLAIDLVSKTTEVIVAPDCAVKMTSVVSAASLKAGVQKTVVTSKGE